MYGKTEERALQLLGSGVNQEQTAAALGVSPSYISQLMSQEDFSEAVQQLRFESLNKNNERDATYDALEDKLLQKLNKNLHHMYKPRDILGAIKVINGAKRRGQSSQEQVTNKQTIVNLMIPTVVAQKMVVSQDNHVVKAGEQSLVSIQSNSLVNRIKEKEAARLEQYNKELTEQEDNDKAEIDKFNI